MDYIKIETPRGFISENENGKVKLIWKEGFGKEVSGQFNKAQKFVDSECLRYCDPLVPLQSSMLKKSGILGTVIGSGEIQYNAPYARQQYYNNQGRGIEGTMRSGQRGRLWFKRMAVSNGKQILAGAKRLVGAR